MPKKKRRAKRKTRRVKTRRKTRRTTRKAKRRVKRKAKRRSKPKAVKAKVSKPKPPICKAYKKSVGKGVEIGLKYEGKQIFVGNFVNSGEASRFYGLMKREMRKFARKYKIGPNFPKSWHRNFIAGFVGQHYYNYVNRMVTKNRGAHVRAANKGSRLWKRLNKKWPKEAKAPSLKAA